MRQIVLLFFAVFAMSLIASPISLIKVVNVEEPRLENRPSNYARTSSSNARSEITSVSWNPNHSRFREGVSYTVTVKLVARKGEYFSNKLDYNRNGGATINGRRARVTNFTPSRITLQYTFPALRCDGYHGNNRPSYRKEITSLQIQDVYEPQLGVSVDTRSIKIKNGGVNSKITSKNWYPSHSHFRERTSYTVKVKVRANDDAFFSPRLRNNSNGGVTVNGRRARVVSVSDEYISIEYTYPALRPAPRAGNDRL